MLKKNLEQMAEEQARLEGELRAINRQLEEEFGLKSWEEAERLLVKEREEIKRLEVRLEKKLEEVERILRGEA